MNQKIPKIGLALGSGGAKGLAHIGVLKALEKENIEISYIAGTSIGSIIGAYYAAHPSLVKLEEFVFNLNRRMGFKLFDPVLRGGIIKGNKVEMFISDMLDGASFESLRIPLSVIATDMKSAEEIVIKDGNLIKAIRASISVPPVFTPVKYHNRLLADGGLSDPVPVDAVRKMGADIVIAVNVESGYFYEPVEKIPMLAGIPMHSVNILRHNITFHSLKTADIVISPTTPYTGLIGWNYFFDSEKAASIIKAGEKAAEKMLPEIKALIKQKHKQPSRWERLQSYFSRIN